jgi:hypothetical protein
VNGRELQAAPTPETWPMRSYVVVSGIVFDVLTALQLIRLLLGWPVIVNGFAVPLWVSGVAAIVAGSLAVWAMRLLMQTRSRPAAA